MPRRKLNEDCFFELAAFLDDDLKQIVRFWVALCLRNDVTKNSVVWREILKRYLASSLSACNNNYNTLINNETIASLRFRAGVRADIPYLNLIGRLYCKRKCSRSGCFEMYQEISNHATACRHHSGKMRNRFLSCCRERSFRALGCKQNFHDGVLFEFIHYKREKIEEEDTLSLPKISLPPPTCTKDKQQPVSKDSQQLCLFPDI